jgi:hypothetical protein
MPASKLIRRQLSPRLTHCMLSSRKLSIQKLHEPDRRLPRSASPALNGPDARSSPRQATNEAMQSGKWPPTVMPTWVGRPRYQRIKRLAYWRATDIARGGSEVVARARSSNFPWHFEPPKSCQPPHFREMLVACAFFVVFSKSYDEVLSSQASTTRPTSMGRRR